MKVNVQLFLCVIVATSQASLYPQKNQQLARQGAEIDPLYEKFKEVFKTHGLDTREELDPKTILIPNIYKTAHLRTYLDPDSKYAALNRQNDQPKLNTGGNIMSRSVQLRQSAQSDIEAQNLQYNARLEAILAKLDREALSKLSEADRVLLVSRFSQAERKKLLTKLDEGEIEVVPTGSRFAGAGVSGVAAQLGAGAGGYIGGKLGGSLGAKLGAAAGAYLAAAAASRLNTWHKSTSITSDQTNKSRGINYGSSYGGSYGAMLVKSK